MKKVWKKSLVLLLSLLIICTIGTLSAYAAPAGEGTETSPYQISSEEDLIWFSQLVDDELTDGTAQNTEAWAELTNDIELTQEWNPIADEYIFEGNFDGKGYTISGLNININNESDDVYASLFGENEGTIKNVNVEGSITVTGKGGYVDAAGISGANYGTIESCTSNVTIDVEGEFDAYIGGIAGYNVGSIISCENNGDISVEVSSYALVGGISGYSNHLISDCHNTGSVTASTDTGTSAAGGVCGYNDYPNGGGTIEYCSSKEGKISSSVDGNSDYDTAQAGGISGYHNGASIEYCTNSSEVESTGKNSYAGGISSRSHKAITSCTNTGTISGGANAGGISGLGYGGTISTCSNSGTVSGGEAGGICGVLYHINSGDPKPIINGCSNSGDVTGISGKTGAICGNNVYNGGTVDNSYFLNDEGLNAVGTGNAGSNLQGFSQEEYAEKVLELLNGSGSNDWIIINGTPAPNIPATVASLSETNITLYVNEQAILNLEVEPSIATYKEIIWESDDDDIATVENGTITALKVGSADITATVIGYNDEVQVSEQCTVTVERKSSGGGYIPQKTLTFDTNGGSKINAVTDNYGKTIVLADYTPKRTGYDFVGWYKDKELTEKIEYAILDYDMTVYAKWQANGEDTEDGTVETKIILVINDKTAVIDGKAVTNDVAPLIVNGRTYTPARFVAEALGAKVEWNESTRTVTITKDDTNIVLLIDSATAYVNGEAVKMDASAFIADGRTFTPARFVAENLGAQVEWDEATKTVTIIKYAK